MLLVGAWGRLWGGEVRLPRSVPEAQGVSSAALLEFVEAADRTLEGLHSLMVLRHGRVLAEGWWAPYASGSNHELYSLSKSFTSTAVGMAIAEGRFSLDDEVVKLFPEALPAEVSANLKSMRVRDLLTMNTGHQEEPPTSADKVSVRTFLEQKVPHKPGTHFRYNTAATFMLSAIVQKKTGQSLLEYLRPRLFQPLGIEHPVWESNAEGISLGGYGLRVGTEDIACFGQMYLQKGRWNGKALLPASWVELATSRQVSNGSNPASDWDQGYGFQFWRSRHGAYRGDGAFGQFCLVLPEQDAVVVITSGLGDMQSVLNLVWDKLLPAFKPGRLGADPGQAKALATRLAALKVRPALGGKVAEKASSLLGRRIVLPGNQDLPDWIRLDPGADGRSLVWTARSGGREQRVECGHDEWRAGRGFFFARVDEPLAGSYGWTGPGELQVRLCTTEMPYVVTVTLRLAEKEVTVDGKFNVNFGPTELPRLTGRLE